MMIKNADIGLILVYDVTNIKGTILQKYYCYKILMPLLSLTIYYLNLVNFFKR